MSNQFQTITSGLAELKNYYQGPLVDQFNEDIPVYRGAEKMKKGWSGLQVVRPLRVRRNQGIGATSDNGILPKIGRQTTQQALISAKFNYLRFGVTGPMIKSSQSDVGSFVRSASYELEMGYKDLMSDMNRQLSWDGTGWLAQVASNAVATNSIDVYGREGTISDPDQFLDVGLTFDVYTQAGAVVITGVTITAISVAGSTATLTLDQNVTVSATNVLVRAGSYGNEVQGLLTALDGGTSTIYNIDRATYTQYKGNEVDLAGAQLTLDSMQRSWNLGERRGGGKYNALYTDFDSQRFYQKLLTADKRYVNTVSGDGAFANKDKKYLDFGGIPLVADKDCPRRIFFLDRNAIEAWVLSEMEFADETGSMYIAQTDTDAFEVRVRFFMNLFNAQPAACAALTGYISP